MRKTDLFAQSVLDALAVPACLLDEHGRTILTNRAWDRDAAAHPLGATVPMPESCAGSSCLTACDQAESQGCADARSLASGIRSVISGPLEQFEYEYACHAPGAARWFLAKATRFIDGRRTWIIITREDITKRKQAEDLLTNRNRMLLAIQQVMLKIGTELRLPVLLSSILEQAQSLLEANRGGGIYFYEAEEDVLRLAHGSGINQGRDGITVRLGEGVAGRIYRTAQPLIIDDYTRWNEHATILVADPPSTVMGVPLWLDGAVIGVLTLIANSQQRKFTDQDVQQAEMFAAQATVAIRNAKLYEQAQAEELQRQKDALYYQMFTGHSALMLLIDPQNGAIVDANPAASRFYGYPIETLCRMNIHEINTLPPKAVEQAYRDAYERKRSFFEFKHRLASGEVRDVEVRSVPIEVTGRALLYSICHDITDRKQAESALESALQEKQDLLQELQHRAKNSFAMALSMIGLMQNASQNDETRASLSDLRTRMQAMSILYDLLYVTNAVTHTLLDVYCTQVVASLPLPGNIRTVQAYDRVTVPVKTAATLGLILTELVTNAAKHAFPNGRSGTVSISLRQVDDTMVLHVEDDGVGLPASARPMQSACLGLTMVRALAGQMRGCFRSESKNGTRCVVEFPLEDAHR